MFCQIERRIELDPKKKKIQPVKKTRSKVDSNLIRVDFDWNRPIDEKKRREQNGGHGDVGLWANRIDQPRMVKRNDDDDDNKRKKKCR